MQTTRVSTLAMFSGACAPVVWTAAWLAASLAQPQYDVRRDYISGLAAVTARSPGIMSVAVAVVTIAAMLAFQMRTFPAWNGVVQRVFISAPFLWMEVLAIRLARSRRWSARGTARPPVPTSGEAATSARAPAG
ncbi:MAG: hypothetical protein FJZ92_04685 [Chloroflexi bacterium]|nr:hypothetical protein [Chloroflexota bacterium]